MTRWTRAASRCPRRRIDPGGPGGPCSAYDAYDAGYVTCERERGSKAGFTSAVTLFVLVGLTAVAPYAHAQTPTPRSDIIRNCSGACALQVEEVVTLGDTTGATDGFVGRPAALLQRPDGSFLLADRLDPGALKLFSPEGEFVRRVGRQGEGPGEYQIVQFLFLLPGDSVEVLDLGQQRSTVLTSDLRVARTTAAVPVAAEMLRLNPSRYVITARINSPEQVGLPLHFVSPGEGIVNSFGAEPMISEIRTSDLFYRQLAKGSQTDFWAAHLTAYILENYDDAGNLLTRLRREVAWFQPHDDFGSVAPDNPPSPGVRALHVDENGYVWVLISVPDADWEAALTPVVSRFGGEAYDYDPSSVYDTVIEVIDPKRSVVVGETTIDAVVRGFTPRGLMYAVEQSENLEPYVRVWRVSGPWSPTH